MKITNYSSPCLYLFFTSNEYINSLSAKTKTTPIYHGVEICNNIVNKLNEDSMLNVLECTHIEGQFNHAQMLYSV